MKLAFCIMNKQDTSVITHYEHEIHTWERALDFYAGENSYLKTWLSELVDNSRDKAFVHVAEYFDNRFLFIDDYIKVFRQDLRTQIHSIALSKEKDKTYDEQISRNQQKLRQEMKEFEKALALLRTEFTGKMTASLGIN